MKLLRRHQWMTMGALAAAMAIGIAANAIGIAANMAWAQNENEATQDGGSGQAEGLAVLYESGAPDDLDFEVFLDLDGNWSEWSSEVRLLVARLYQDEGLLDFDAGETLPEGDTTIAAQRALIDTLEKKLDTMRRALDDPAYRSLHVPIARLYSNLRRRVGLADALLDTLTLDPGAARRAQRSEAAEELRSALDALTADLESIPRGTRWLPYVKADRLRQLAETGLGEDATETLQAVWNKLTKTEGLSAEQSEFLSRSSFGQLADAVEQALAVSQRDYEPPDREKLVGLLKQLVENVENFESTSKIADAKAVRETHRAVADVALDGGDRLDRALRAYYFNYNVHLTVSEGLMDAMVDETRRENGQVVDYILGANVYGWQWTTTNVGIDLKPSQNGALLELTADGYTQSSTRGVTDKATIFTSGYHRFRVEKPILFTGDELVAQQARIGVNANNTTTGATTDASGVPILGGIARNIAISEARKKKGASEAIAASRVRNRVLPRFEEEASEQIAKANDDLQNKVNQKLRDAGLFPSARKIRSTEDSLLISSRLMGDGELGGSRVRAPETPANGLTVQVHETAANNAIDRLEIAGKTMDEDELLKTIEQNVSDLVGRKITLNREQEPEGEEREITTFAFDEQDPIRIRFRDGNIVIVIRAGFIGVGKNKEDIPNQIVTIELNLTAQNGQIAVARNVSVRDAAGGVQARSRVISDRIESAIKERNIDGTVEFKPDPDADREPIALNVTGLEARGGWFTLTLDQAPQQ